MSKLDNLLKITVGDLQRTLWKWVNNRRNRVTFDGIADTLIDGISDNVSGSIQTNKCLQTKPSSGAVFFALTIFFRDRFNLDLNDKATNLMSEYFSRLNKGTSKYSSLEKSILLC